MGNVIGSIASGFCAVVGKIFGSPLEFLSGKSCSSVCGSTWDFICYIENFCIANLLKMAMVFFLSYFVLLFLYLLHKLGICECICWTLCRMFCSCISAYFHACEWCCSFCLFKLFRPKRSRRDYYNTYDEFDDVDRDYSDRHGPRQLVEFNGTRRSLSGQRRRRKDYRRAHRIRMSLRPRSHRNNARVGIIGRKRSSPMYKDAYNNDKHGYDHVIRNNSTFGDASLSRKSKFARKRRRHRLNLHRTREGSV